MSSSATHSLGLLAGLLTLAACASQQGPDTQRFPDGSIAIRCRAPLGQCLARADTLCKGKTYEVLRARDQRDTYGPEMGTAKVEVRSSEAIIRCTSGGRPLTGWDSLTPPSAAPVAAAPPPPRACVPGTTQACIGPGKCEGGQSCLPDASAFGPCDCGTLGPPVAAPAPAPTEPAMAATGAPPPAPPPATPSTTTGKPAPAAPGTAAPGVTPATPLKK